MGPGIGFGLTAGALAAGASFGGPISNSEASACELRGRMKDELPSPSLITVIRTGRNLLR
jgi:hypothetical protein